MAMSDEVIRGKQPLTQQTTFNEITTAAFHLNVHRHLNLSKLHCHLYTLTQSNKLFH
jgi:hypothetical protein